MKNVLKFIGVTSLVIFAFVAWYIAENLFGLKFRFAKTSELQAMEKVASVIHIANGNQINRWQQDSGSTLGKPDYAEIRLDYAPVGNYSNADVIREIAQVLEKNNFHPDRLEQAGPDYYHAYLPLQRFNVAASVINVKENHIVRVYLSTYLRASPTTSAPKLDIYNLKTK